MTKLYYSQRGDKIETTDPVTVSRYRGFTRVNHWVTALSLIALLLSGMALFSPYLYFLTAWRWDKARPAPRPVRRKPSSLAPRKTWSPMPKPGSRI